MSLPGQLLGRTCTRFAHAVRAKASLMASPFVNRWPRDVSLEHMPLTQPQLQALVLGLPWQRLEDDGAIRLL